MIRMESLLSQIDRHWARTLLEFSKRDPSLLKNVFDEMPDKTQADIEMAANVQDPVDPRVVKIACLNGLCYTLNCCLSKGYSLSDEEIGYVVKYAVGNEDRDMMKILEKVDVPEQFREQIEKMNEMDKSNSDTK